MARQQYEVPTITTYGSIQGLTGATTLVCSHVDKIGSSSDDYTPAAPNESGTWVPDQGNSC